MAHLFLSITDEDKDIIKQVAKKDRRSMSSLCAWLAIEYGKKKEYLQ